VHLHTSTKPVMYRKNLLQQYQKIRECKTFSIMLKWVTC